MYKYLAILALVAIVALGYSEANICQSYKSSTLAVYVRDQHNCSAYDICFGGRSLGKVACPSELVFSINLKVCVRKGQENDDCNTTETLGGIYDDPLCNDYPSGNNRNPNNCHSYIPCFNHTSMTVMQCPETLQFSLKLQRCVHRDDSDCKLNKET